MGERAARIRLIKTDAGQRIDLPPGFILGGEEAMLRQDGSRLILEPVAGPSLLSVLDRLDDLDEAWPDIADPAPEPERT
ncbi:AbrB/MazE/SpoVT family DNA-binding domain-containing protein [Methylobacterium sp. J-030]|nr:AbrB/MazE/SpoVT family DNA-binding domain-containing protein [Methylobacterium sp. J-030]